MAVNGRNTDGANGGVERDPALDRLYREAAGETPPAHLDAAVLAAARREAGARPRPLAPMLRRWHVAVSIAAVVVVSMSLVILVRDEGRMESRYAKVPEAASLRSDPAAAPSPLVQAEAREQGAEREQAVPDPPRQLPREDAGLAAAPGKPVEEAPRMMLSAPATPGVGAVATPTTAAKPVLQPMLAAPPEATRERAAPASADAVTGGRTAAAPTEPLTVRSEAAGPEAKARAGVLAAKPSGEDRLPVWSGFEKEPPEKWLAHIEELRKQGRAADAEEMLSEFKRRFPGHPAAPPAAR